MRIRFLTLSILLILGIGIISYKVTHALFSDVAQSTDNTFAAAQIFPGSPGSVVINEVYYDVCSPASTCGTEPQNEWVELYNNTSSAIDLTGWTIEENQASPDTLPSGTIIPANGFLVVTPEAETFDFWPAVSEDKRVILGSHFGNGLANSGDRVILKDNTGEVIDAMSYGTDITQLNPAETDVAQGHSLERDPDGVDTNTNADFVDRTIPTPGG